MNVHATLDPVPAARPPVEALEIRGVSHSFGANRVLSDVALTVLRELCDNADGHRAPARGLHTSDSPARGAGAKRG